MVAAPRISCSVIFLPLPLPVQLLSPLFLYCFTPKSIFLISSRIDLTISYHQQSSPATWSGPILLFFSSSVFFFFFASPTAFFRRESFQMPLPLSVSPLRSMTSTGLQSNVSAGRGCDALGRRCVITAALLELLRTIIWLFSLDRKEALSFLDCCRDSAIRSDVTPPIPHPNSKPTPPNVVVLVHSTDPSTGLEPQAGYKVRCVFLEKRQSDGSVRSRGGVAGDTHNLKQIKVLNLTNTGRDRDALFGIKNHSVCAPDTPE